MEKDSKINRIKELYGEDFGIGTLEELGDYLRKKGWESLADLL